MKSYFILFFILIEANITRACELPVEDPFKEFMLDQEILKEERLKLLRAAFNKRFPLHNNTDFEERVKAIEDTSHPLRQSIKNLAQAYIVLNWHDEKINALGVISSKRQLTEVLGSEYNHVLRTTSHILFNHFKCEELADGEIIDVGALLLGTSNMAIMFELIKYDLKNDCIKMAQKASQGKLNE